MRRISELSKIVTVTRPAKDVNGNRFYEELSFEMPYIAGIRGNQIVRLFAKLIDYLPFFLIFYSIGFNFWLSLLGAYLPHLLVSAWLEHKFGQTLGKLIFGLKVLNDFGNKPSFPKSILRNLMAILNLTPFEYLSDVYDDHPYRNQHRFVFHMEINNIFCKTYVVPEEQIDEIRELQRN